MRGSSQMKSIDRRQAMTKLLRKYNWRCAVCGRSVRFDVDKAHPLRATIDHIVARALGGSNQFQNLQLACFSCNNSKGLTSESDEVKRMRGEQ